MRILFWLCAAIIVYAYVGYALWLKTLVFFQRRPVQRAPLLSSVSILIAVRNEARNLPAKLANLALLAYPKDRLQIIIASDGSTDQTATLLQANAPHIFPLILEQSNGKAFALNQMVRQSTGDLLVFLDVRQTVDADAITELVSCFADSEVGAVSGELLLENSSEGPSNGLGLYWKLEKIVRKLESATGSVVGVTGAIYAIRRELYTEIPIGTILDDVFVPMNVIRKGKRVIFQPSAIARDRLFTEHGKEFSRKVRTLTGNYQLLRLAPWTLTPANPLLFRFISHKLLRLIVPLLLVILLAASAIIHGRFYTGLFCLQTMFYVLAMLGVLRPSTNRYKPISIPYAFVVLNAAAAVAFYNFIARRKQVWV